MSSRPATRSAADPLCDRRAADAIEAGHARTRWNIWNAVKSRTTTNSSRR